MLVVPPILGVSALGGCQATVVSLQHLTFKQRFVVFLVLRGRIERLPRSVAIGKQCFDRRVGGQPLRAVVAHGLEVSRLGGECHERVWVEEQSSHRRRKISSLHKYLGILAVHRLDTLEQALGVFVELQAPRFGQLVDRLGLLREQEHPVGILKSSAGRVGFVVVGN